MASGSRQGDQMLGAKRWEKSAMQLNFGACLLLLLLFCLRFISAAR